MTTHRADSGAAQLSQPYEGFRLAAQRSGSGRPVVGLHGWPGDRHDWNDVVHLLDGRVDFCAVDLRGFGESDAHALDPAQAYTPGAQARSVLALIEEWELDPVVIVGYDLGSMVAEQIARIRPQAVAALVLSPPVPGLGVRLADPQSVRERWYIAFHQTGLAAELLDGHRDAVHAYLSYFWSTWSGPGFRLDDRELERLVDRYSVPGAFTASTTVYRSGRPSGDATPLPAPATILWPDSDPLFPAAWSADLDQGFSDAELIMLPDTGHFTPREAPEAFSDAILRHV